MTTDVNSKCECGIHGQTRTIWKEKEDEWLLSVKTSNYQRFSICYAATFLGIRHASNESVLKSSELISPEIYGTLMTRYLLADDSCVKFFCSDPKSLPQVSDYLKAGSILGVIGNSSHNGGWFYHLHLQVMSYKYIDSFNKNYQAIDGYNSINLSWKFQKEFWILL